MTLFKVEENDKRVCNFSYNLIGETLCQKSS